MRQERLLHRKLTKGDAGEHRARSLSLPRARSCAGHDPSPDARGQPLRHIQPYYVGSGFQALGGRRDLRRRLESLAGVGNSVFGESLGGDSLGILQPVLLRRG